MKTQVASVLFALTLCAFSFTAPAQGIIGITSLPTATTATYDAIVTKLQAQNLMEFGWTYHAVGAAQPAGLFSIGIYPDQAALEARIEKVRPVLQEVGGGSIPMPASYEIINTYSAAMPAARPANAVLVFIDGKGITEKQYTDADALLKKALAPNRIPAGNYLHVAFRTPDGVKVVDIWESPEAFQAFGATLIPILQSVGMPPIQPTFYGLYNVVIPK